MKINMKSIVLGALIGIFSPAAPLIALWQPPVIVSDTNLPVDVLSGPVLRVSPQGNAISVWTYNRTFTFNQAAMASSFYTRGIGWEPPQIISNLQLNSANKPLYTAQGDPDIDFNSKGYAVAVWEGEFSEEPNFPNVIIAARRSASGIWSPVENISDESGDFFSTNASVAVNEAGTALAAWRQYDNDATDVTAVSFLPFGGSWTTPFLFPGEPAIGGDNKPYPEINPSGNAVVVWKAFSTRPNTSHIKAATFNALANSWTGPVDLESIVGSPNLVSQTPRVDMDANGKAVAVWNIDAGLARAAYFNGTTWEPTITLGATGGVGVSDGVDVTTDLQGNFTAVWSGPFVDPSVFSSSRLPGGAWTSPQAISVPGTINEFAPFMSQVPLAASNEGDVIATWLEQGAGIKAAFKPFGQDWRFPETVFSERDQQIYLNAGIASCGFAVALWEVIPEVGNPVVKASVNENLLLPQNARGKRCCDSFAAQKRCINILNWDPDACALSFNVYRDGVLIANVPNNGAIKFVDPLGCKKKNHLYTITLVNIYGFEGDPIPVVF